MNNHHMLISANLKHATKPGVEIIFSVHYSFFAYWNFNPIIESDLCVLEIYYYFVLYHKISKIKSTVILSTTVAIIPNLTLSISNSSNVFPITFNFSSFGPFKIEFDRNTMLYLSTFSLLMIEALLPVSNIALISWLFLIILISIFKFGMWKV